MTVEDVPSASVPNERSLLKAHKVLPRRPLQEQPPAFGAGFPVPSQEDRVSPSSHRASSPSLRSDSPVQDPILPTGAIALPPTPPKNPFDTSDGNAGLGLRVRKTRGKRPSQSSGASTPRNQRSPPTPDITPPREPLKPLAFDQHQSRRVPSSRTESFSTAREQQPLSDEETGRQPFYSANLTRNNSANASRSASARGFGLGLDFESDGEGAAALSRSVKQPFLNFDGGWDNTEGSPGMDWNDEMMKNITVRKSGDELSRSKALQLGYTDDPLGSGSDGLEQRKQTDQSWDEKNNGGTDDFAESTPWPTRSHAGSPDADDRRLSSTSMIVEAMVVDTAPQRTRTLRHTSKNSHLRSSLPDRGRSVSNPEGQYLLQGRGNSRSLGKPRRAVSDASASIGFDGRPQQEVIPVVVIPERRSSLSASTSKSARTSSLTSVSVQTRALPNTGGAFDTTLPRRRRTLSDSIPLTSGSDKGRGRDSYPVIPQRRSSLSAPTSRNVSRTTSLTSEGIKFPGDSLDTDGPSDVQAQLGRSLHAYMTNQNSQYADDTGIPQLKRLVSPRHSQFSETSKSPEVIEATAVSIFPHNNESILVVQQNSRNTSGGLSFSASAAAPETPPMKHQETLSVESPLKNPRKPPKPPAFKIIPPTPMVMTPAEEYNRQLPSAKRPSTAGGRLFGGPLSHVKRALSGRRNAGEPLQPTAPALAPAPAPALALAPAPALAPALAPAPAPAPAPKGVDGSTQTEGGSPGFRRPSLSDASRRDSKLHPFWKPRGFWDDLEDDDDYQHLEEHSARWDSAPVSTHEKSGTEKRTSSYLAKDADNLHHISPRRSSESLTVGKDQKTRRGHRIPGLGIRIEYIGWQGIQERIKEARARRENEAKEKQRSKLRQQIGTPRVIVQSLEV
ncbi:hypothetical protein GP486_007346 [Trichoglossum hirsutum]|uniref:Uncharacterized protein n=1 Tax=Trichoglossum hirsutum TaxID=265104 RepID=A0A9P8IC16_9PEZI|nr:hypothetical protein GP486_007346 [Trichoglossum hirsutum]